MISQPHHQHPGLAVGGDTYPGAEKSLTLNHGVKCEECRRKRIRCDRGTPQCSSCVVFGAKCVVRDTHLPRGPKKGYLKTLQKKIGGLAPDIFYFNYPFVLIKVKEELQAQLDKQQVASTTEIQIPSPPQEGTNASNGDGSILSNDELGNHIPNTDAVSTTTTNFRNLSAAASFPFPLIPLAPWEGIGDSCPDLLFPILDQYQEPPQAPMDAKLNISPMMHSDLYVLHSERKLVSQVH